jgi:hypothetical protein
MFSLRSAAITSPPLSEPARYAPTSTSRYTTARSGGYSPASSSYTSSLPPPSPTWNATVPFSIEPNGPAPAQHQDTWTPTPNRTEDSATPDTLSRARNEEELELQPAQQCDSADVTDIHSPSTTSDGGASPPPASSSSSSPSTCRRSHRHVLIKRTSGATR